MFSGSPFIPSDFAFGTPQAPLQKGDRYDKDRCATCHKSEGDAGVTLLRCAGCRGPQYCCRECQKVHWKAGGHKAECKAIRAEIADVEMREKGMKRAINATGGRGGVGGSAAGAAAAPKAAPEAAAAGARSGGPKPGGGAQTRYKYTLHPSALHIAAFEGKVNTVRNLLEKHADVHARFDDGETPLHQVAQAADSAGHRDVARMLLEWGADVNAVDDGGITPLACAAYEGWAGMCRVLLEGGAKDLPDEVGRTAFIKAMTYGHRRRRS